MNTPDTHEHPKHESHEGTYIGIFAVLGALTFSEVLVTYTAEALRYPLLVLLMTIKAILVVTFYMHLRWEKRFYIVIIAFPMVLAALVALAVQQLVR